MAQSKEWYHQYYLKNKEKIKIRVKKYRYEHKEWANKKSGDWRKRNPEKAKEIQRKYGERNKTKIIKRRKDYYIRNHTRLLERSRICQQKLNLKLKIRVLRHYGNGKCVCVLCGMNNLDCLSLDHIYNNGSIHRKTLGFHSIYRTLEKQNYPEGYQTLCMNCQWIKKAEYQRQRRLPSRS